jgi:hypothetical protein
MKAINVALILRKIRCPVMALYKGDGYWYFVYDSNGVFETKSVMTMRLKDLTLDMWVAEGCELRDRGDKLRIELIRQRREVNQMQQQK